MVMVQIHDAHSQSTLIPVAARRDMVFDNGGKYLYVTTSTGSVQRYSLSTGQIDKAYTLGGSLNGADIAPDDSFLLVGQNNLAGTQGVVQKLDLNTGAVTSLQYTPVLDEGGGWDVAIDANGRALFTTNGPNWCWVRQVDLATNTITVRKDATAAFYGTGVPQPVYNGVQLRRSADGTRIACYESRLSSHAIFIYNTATDNFSPYVQALNASPGGASLNRNGTLLGTQLNTPASHTASLDTVPDLDFVYAFKGADGDVVFDAIRDIVYAVNSSTDQIVAYNTSTRAEQFRLNIGENVAPGADQFTTGMLVASQDGRHLALETVSGIRLFAIPQPLPQPAPTPTPSLADRRDMVFDHSGKYLYVGTSTGFVMRYNLATNLTDSVYDLGGSLNGIDIAPDDSFLIACQDNTGVIDGTVQKVDLGTGQISNIPFRRNDEGGGWDVAIGSNGLALLTSQLNGIGLTAFREIDLGTNSISFLFDFPRFGHWAAVGQNSMINRSADYTRLFLLSTDYRGPAFTYNAVTNTFETPVWSDRDLSSASGAVSRNGSLLATRFGDYIAFDGASDLDLKRVLAGDGGIAFDSVTDTFYATNSSTDQLVAYDTNTFQEKFRIDIGEPLSPGVTPFGTGTLVASPDGRYVALETPSGIKVLTVSPPPVSGSPPPPDLTNTRGMVFDHSAQYLYIATGSGLVYRYDIATGALGPFYDLGGSLNGIDIAPDDSFLIVAQSKAGLSEGTFHRVDLASGTVTNINYQRQPSEFGGWNVAIAGNGLALVSPEYGPFNSFMIRQIDLATNVITSRPDAPPVNGSLAMLRQTQIRRSADRARLYFLEPGLPTSPIYLYTSLTNTFGPAVTTNATYTGANTSVSRDGSLLATRGFNAGLYTVPNFSLVQRFTVLDSGVAFDPVNDLLYGVSTSAEQIIAYDTKTFAEQFRIDIGEPIPQRGPEFGPGSLVASQDGRYLALVTSTAVRVLDTSARATPTPAPAATLVDGAGSINAPVGQASFAIQGVGMVKGKKNKSKITGSFSYNDPAVPLTLSAGKVTSVTISGNHSSFSGTAKGSGKKGKISFTVNVTDNGLPGTSDTFSISLSNGYSASGNLTSGDISVH
jgi:hypothetical protein